MKYLIFILSLFFLLPVEANNKYLIYNGDESEKKIYLTFDDGYSQKNIIAILDILKEENCNAAFFIEGDFLINNPNVCKRIANEQMLCNHTMCHCDITKLSNEELILDIKEFEENVFKITGKQTAKYFRPPMGYINKEKENVIYDLGYEIIMWNATVYDYNSNDDQGVDYVIDNLIPQIDNGSIILMHTLTESNVEALPIIINKLRDAGFIFESLNKIKGK